VRAHASGTPLGMTETDAPRPVPEADDQAAEDVTSPQTEEAAERSQAEGDENDEPAG
jgi:hypothetical protein